jgi:hypothetical protein
MNRLDPIIAIAAAIALGAALLACFAAHCYHSVNRYEQTRGTEKSFDRSTGVTHPGEFLPKD